MSSKGKLGNRRSLGLVLGTVGVGAAIAAVVAVKSFPLMLAPKIVGTKRPASELVLPPKVPAAQALARPQAEPAPLANSAVAASPMTAPQIQADAPALRETVEGPEYISELARAAELSELEQARMQPFLETIARSQELVERVADPDRRADMVRRIQYQAVYGMKLRVAPEKRDKVAELLRDGVPRLLFPNAKQPEAVTHKSPVTPG